MLFLIEYVLILEKFTNEILQTDIFPALWDKLGQLDTNVDFFETTNLILLPFLLTAAGS